MKYPRFYGGTVDPETGEVFDARRHPAAPSRPKRDRSKTKAAKAARRKNRASR